MQEAMQGVWDLLWWRFGPPDRMFARTSARWRNGVVRVLQGEVPQSAGGFLDLRHAHRPQEPTNFANAAAEKMPSGSPHILPTPLLKNTRSERDPTYFANAAVEIYTI